jgi:hypothetical protein
MIELAGDDLKPYAPVHLAASGSFGADTTLSRIRRTRVGGDLKDGFEKKAARVDMRLPETLLKGQERAEARGILGRGARGGRGDYVPTRLRDRFRPRMADRGGETLTVGEDAAGRL